MFACLHKWVSGSPTKYIPFIFSLSAFLLKKNVIKKNVIGSVGHHQFYIHWSSAGTHHTYKLSRESVNVLQLVSPII